MNTKLILKISAAMLGAILLSGCTSTPRKTVELSEQLGVMIQSTKDAHLALVDQYIEDRKSRADEFLNEKWFPDFMKDFTQTSGIDSKLKDESSPDVRAKMLRQFSEAAASQLQERRSTVMDSLNAVRRELYQKLNDHYHDMRVTNEALTAHLLARAKESDIREEILKRANLPVQEILPIDKLNGALEKLVEFRGKIDEARGMVDKAKTIIKQGASVGK